MGKISRLSDRLCDRIEEYLAEVAPDEDLEYDMMIGADGNGTPIAVITVAGRTAVLDVKAQTVSIIPFPAVVTDEKLKVMANDVIQSIYKQRADLLLQTSPEALPAADAAAFELPGAVHLG